MKHPVQARNDFLTEDACYLYIHSTQGNLIQLKNEIT